MLDRDLADHAIRWIDLHKSVHPDKPFLMYYAPGTAHGPNHAPRAWIAPFRGKFDEGGESLHREIFRRQKAMGIIPANARANPRPGLLPAWNSLTPEQRRVSARMMEMHAAQLAFFDDQMVAFTDELKRLGQYDNTLIIYVRGDNGASLGRHPPAAPACPRGSPPRSAPPSFHHPSARITGLLPGRLGADVTRPASGGRTLNIPDTSTHLRAPKPVRSGVSNHRGARQVCRAKP